MKINNRRDQDYLKTLTVLYVEDDADTREQFSDFLRRSVGTLIAAENGVAGLEAFKKYMPDIVVTDILMPQMDGLSMAQAMLEMKPSVPIIVVTAFEQTDYLMRAINMGIEKYVTKPVNSYQLFESLLTCAHRLRAEEQLKLQHQQEIREAWSKQNETSAALAGGFAHDYNNMMQAILGYAALAKMQLEPGSEANNYLEKIEKYSDEADALSQNLRLLGHNFYGKMEHGMVMQCVLSTIRNALTGTSVSLSADCSEDLPCIRFDAQQLHFVFSGLATNAVEAMPAGGMLRLSMQAVNVSDHDFLPVKPGTYIQISLSDSGDGIPSDVLPKIFDPYFSTKQRSCQRGMGLSLALCRTVIMEHGGSIAAESAPGNGATFHIWLPTA
ncbi:MAG: response regulator [Desulfuromonadaceae bacterium]